MVVFGSERAVDVTLGNLGVNQIGNEQSIESTIGQPQNHLPCQIMRLPTSNSMSQLRTGPIRYDNIFRFFHWNFDFLTEILILWPKFRFFDRNFDFLTEISIFWPKFWFFTEILIFWPKFYFWPNFRIFTLKFRFLTDFAIFKPKFLFYDNNFDRTFEFKHNFPFLENRLLIKITQIKQSQLRTGPVQCSKTVKWIMNWRSGLIPF